MHKIREILRLREQQGREHRFIALSVGASPSTVFEYLRRAREADISFELARTLSDSELRERLFPKGRGGVPAGGERAPFDAGHVHIELRRAGVTLLLLWQEYVEAAERDGQKPYSYSQFCDRYKLYKKSLTRTVRLVHRAGEKCFIDYSGKRPNLVDKKTGDICAVELFVMTMGASGYTYAEASLSQTVPDFCSSIIRGLEHFGGVPEVLVPDQLRSAVSRPCRYDPDIHRTLKDLAAHYQTTVLPARPRKPKDKAKVEGAVLLAQRWVLAKLRNETFFSLEELNGRIGSLMKELNAKKFQKLDGSRQSLFETLDSPTLRPLPASSFQLGEWHPARVHPDSHVTFHDRYYSVPAQHVGERVELWVTPSLVEVYLDGARIAAHQRSYQPKGTFVSDEAHLSEAARSTKRWSSERMLSWAETHGPFVRLAVERLFSSYPRAEFGYRAALGIIRLADRYDSAALNAACERALSFSQTAPRRRFLEALLAKEKKSPVARSIGLHEHHRSDGEFEFESLSNHHTKDLH